MSRINKKKIILEIDAEFGSDFQLQSALDCLTAMLKAWVLFYETNHKKNKLKFNLKEETGK